MIKLFRLSGLNAMDVRIENAVAIQLCYDGKTVLNRERIACIAQYLNPESQMR